MLTRDAGAITEDKIWRAYGLLRYARALDYVELMNLLSGVRLGVSLKLLPSPPVYWLNRIMIFSQAAHLAEAAGRTLSTQERLAHRAQYVRQALRGERRVHHYRSGGLMATLLGCAGKPATGAGRTSIGQGREEGGSP